MPAARIFFQLIADLVVYLGLLVRRRKANAAEDLFLRRQLALYQERKVNPWRIDPATRITLALLSRFFNWRDALVPSHRATQYSRGDRDLIDPYPFSR